MRLHIKPEDRPLVVVTTLCLLFTVSLWPYVYGSDAEPVKEEATSTLVPAQPNIKVDVDKPFAFSVDTRKPTTIYHASALTHETTATDIGPAIKVIATGYCSCVACCGPGGTITASGTHVHWGTIAAPKNWPFGSKYIIDELPGTIFTVEDRGGAIRGMHIDIWFSSHAEALRWGRRTVTLRPVQ